MGRITAAGAKGGKTLRKQKIRTARAKDEPGWMRVCVCESEREIESESEKLRA